MKELMVLIFFKKNRVIFSKYVSFFDTRNKKNVKKGHRILRGWTEGAAGPNYRNPPKTKSKKFVKLTDHTCTCNNLTSFEDKTHPPETEIVVNLLKFAWKNS